VIVSSISAGVQLLAVHFGALADRTFYSWIAAYDPKHSQYSPGALLLEALLVDSWRRRDVEFNFLIGDQEYKWFYATHNRVIGPQGSVPLTIRLARAAKRPIRKALSNRPQLLLLARKLMRRLER
jgi:CelD/BcsL family acetyltransferase involved in cellulose biosynthesis